VDNAVGSLLVKRERHPFNPIPYLWTWDKVISGEQTECVFNSCSDKILRWNIVGIQGSLLTEFLNPVYLKVIVLSDYQYSFEHFSRAFYARINEAMLKKDFADYGVDPDRYRLNIPKLGNYLPESDGFNCVS